MTDVIMLCNRRHNPMRLTATSTAIENWATNTAGASDNNEDGLVTSDPT